MAASGGYLISSPGSKILATPATISGAIGAISLIPNLSGLLKHFEIGTDTVAMAESADFPLVDELGGLSEAIKGDAHIIEINPGAVFIQSILKILGIQQESPLAALPQDLAGIIDFHKTLAKFEDEHALYLMPYVQLP